MAVEVVANLVSVRGQLLIVGCVLVLDFAAKRFLDLSAFHVHFVEFVPNYKTFEILLLTIGEHAGFAENHIVDVTQIGQSVGIIYFNSLLIRLV
jgi:hypothetical protein